MVQASHGSADEKGAAVGHAQQRYKDSRFIGMTELSIIAAEPPNPLVNELIITLHIEKRLEAFVRIAHGIMDLPWRCGYGRRVAVFAGNLINRGQQRLGFTIDLNARKSLLMISVLGRVCRTYAGRKRAPPLPHHH